MRGKEGLEKLNCWFRLLPVVEGKMGEMTSCRLNKEKDEAAACSELVWAIISSRGEGSMSGCAPSDGAPASSS